MSKRKAENYPEDPQKRPCTSQATMFKYFQPATCGEHSEARPSTVMTPDYYGIHLYTATEMSSATGLQKNFRTFWNEKARELCADKSVRAKLHSKTAIQGAICASWTLHKTHLLQLQVEEVEDLAKRFHPDDAVRAHLLTPVTSNLDRMLTAYATVNATSESIAALTSTAEKKKMEKELDEETSELKKAQDALVKALERRKIPLLTAKHDEEEKLIASATVAAAIQLSDDEMGHLIETVKNEYPDSTKQ